MERRQLEFDKELSNSPNNEQCLIMFMIFNKTVDGIKIDYKFLFKNF
jgi:hypothetical protein